ncbi:T9SS type A sorting domain-containing protein [Maribellus maritimus]|uniref:T9SS type A sorting domain-containing protein n=1 Tax=Maribellus maritimus TaxID=2870838 RepID=UPI001EEB19A3|nr:T9SS type A sorting domain-containing protein [Maribellus maritimus]MCG6187741.1 T9SS type A sorting domain-containing protein [Maribellus maritimus]
MKKIKLLYAILGIPYFAISQNVVNRVMEYKPAPGQHINIESIGTPQAAENMPAEGTNMVSLGSFGGTIVVGFKEACVNDPENPYGIDFTIFGNAFSGSSEPGVVWVMKDKNKNGIADDTWYEIKGSQHFHSGTRTDYGITYFKTTTRNIFWKDNLGDTGTLKANSYNTQEYYPTSIFFPGYPQDSVTFKGTLLAPAVDSSNPLQYVTEALDFGYADVHARKQGVDLSIPDNPYTNETEGAGGDPIDISWAVDDHGNYVDLDSIHFVKITTGNLASVGWLGEISTDVAYLVDVDANAEMSGDSELLVVFHHKSKIVVGETLQLEAAFFQNGKLEESTFSFISQNQEVATVNSLGVLNAENIGMTEILVSSNGKAKTTKINVVAPDSIEILSDLSSVYIGDTVLLAANVFDNNKDKLEAEIQFELETPGVGSIIEIEGKSYFVASQQGNGSITFRMEGFIQKSVSFKISSESDIIHVYFTAKTETENIIPLQKIEVRLPDLNAFVENRNNDFSGIEHHVLAHAVVSGLQKSGVNFDLRDDENSGGKLYLYSVEKEGEFTYGWGGKTAPVAFAKAWIARVKGSQYLNDFDKVDIADGDTIVLYHISEIINPWNFTQMNVNKDSASINDEVEVTLQKAACTFSDGVITETELVPVYNQEIFTWETNYFSDESGKAVVLISSSPPLTIYSETDAVLISEKIITSNRSFADLKTQIFPNPVDSKLIVNGKNLAGAQMYIFDMNGKNIWSESAFTTSKNIDVQYFNPGIYMLKIVKKSKVKTFKFIKK